MLYARDLNSWAEFVIKHISSPCSYYAGHHPERETNELRMVVFSGIFHSLSINVICIWLSPKLKQVLWTEKHLLSLLTSFRIEGILCVKNQPPLVFKHLNLSLCGTLSPLLVVAAMRKPHFRAAAGLAISRAAKARGTAGTEHLTPCPGSRSCSLHGHMECLMELILVFPAVNWQD